MPALFTVEPVTVVWPDGPPHFGKTKQTWVVRANLLDVSFDTQGEAETVAERLNAALEPLAGFDARSNPLELANAG